MSEKPFSEHHAVDPGNPEAATDRERIKGVFSTQEMRKVGTGTTTKKNHSKSLLVCR